MKVTISCICMLLLLVTMRSVRAATTAVKSATVGLYAPDRYEGIPDMCLMPMDFGYCRAKVKRYYFDMRRMKCNMFYWGGCAGNVNNFKSLEDCNKVCLDAIEDNANTQNAAPAPAPAPSYTSITSRNTQHFAKKTASHTNENDSTNKDNSNTPTYTSSNFNKFKINRNFNIPTSTKEAIVDVASIDDDDDYDN